MTFVGELHLKEIHGEIAGGWVIPFCGMRLGGRQIYETTKPLRYVHEEAGLDYTVPVGTRTDLASVPWFTAWAIPPGGEHQRSAVLHDVLCETPGITWFFAAAVMREAMHRDGVAFFRRMIIYYSILWWGTHYKWMKQVKSVRSQREPDPSSNE